MEGEGRAAEDPMHDIDGLVQNSVPEAQERTLAGRAFRRQVYVGRPEGLVDLPHLPPHGVGTARVAVVDQVAVGILQSNHFFGIVNHGGRSRRRQNQGGAGGVDQGRRSTKARLPAARSWISDFAVKKSQVVQFVNNCGNRRTGEGRSPVTLSTAAMSNRGHLQRLQWHRVHGVSSQAIDAIGLCIARPHLIRLGLALSTSPSNRCGAST